MNQPADRGLPNPRPTDDTLPWFRQFWPWFLIILPGSVVIASLYTVMLAFRSADTLVAKDYYKEGLAINQTVHDLNAAKAMQIKAMIAMGSSLVVELQSSADIPDSSLLLSFQHPLDNLQDTQITLNRLADGKYSAALPTLAAGKWYITLQSISTDKPWRVTTTSYLPADSLRIDAHE